MLSVAQIKKTLKTKAFGHTIIRLESVESTNTYSKKLVQEDAEEGTVVIAEQQTAGRGTHGR